MVFPPFFVAFFVGPLLSGASPALVACFLGDSDEAVRFFGRTLWWMVDFPWGKSHEMMVDIHVNNDVYIYIYMGFINGGSPKWMVYNGKYY